MHLFSIVLFNNPKTLTVGVHRKQENRNEQQAINTNDSNKIASEQQATDTNSN